MKLIQAPYRKTASGNYSDELWGLQWGDIDWNSTQLGHSSIKITLDIYGHLFNDANFSRQQVELLENMFQGSNDLTRERNSV